MCYVKVPSHVERNSRGLADVTSQVPRNKKQSSKTKVRTKETKSKEA